MAFFFTVGHTNSFHALDDDVVTIVGDDGHGADAAQAEDGSEGGVDLAGERTEHPHAAAQRVVGEHRELGEHHAQIGEGQIHDEIVGRRFQRLCLDEQIEHQ